MPETAFKYWPLVFIVSSTKCHESGNSGGYQLHLTPTVVAELMVEVALVPCCTDACE